MMLNQDGAISGSFGDHLSAVASVWIASAWTPKKGSKVSCMSVVVVEGRNLLITKVKRLNIREMW